MSKTTINSRLQNIKNHLNNIQIITDELKKDNSFDQFVIDTLERDIQNVMSDIEKMKKMNDSNDSGNLNYIKNR